MVLHIHTHSSLNGFYCINIQFLDSSRPHIFDSEFEHQAHILVSFGAIPLFVKVEKTQETI